MSTSSKQQLRVSRHNRIRTKVKGTANLPRVAIFKSNRFTYAQVIDDESGKTLISVSDYIGKKPSTGGKAAKAKKTEKASATGKALAEALKKKGIAKVVFDRGGFKYHGRVKALAEGLREGGITL